MFLVKILCTLRPKKCVIGSRRINLTCLLSSGVNDSENDVSLFLTKVSFLLFLTTVIFETPAAHELLLTAKPGYGVARCNMAKPSAPARGPGTCRQLIITYSAPRIPTRLDFHRQYSACETASSFRNKEHFRTIELTDNEFLFSMSFIT